MKRIEKTPKYTLLLSEVVEVIGKLVHKEWDTTLDLQRGEVWDEHREISFIGSTTYRKVAVPMIYIGTVNGMVYVLDGKQRVTAFKRFYSDGFILQNTRQYYSKLDKDFRNAFLTAPIVICDLGRITEENAAEVMQLLNVGAKPMKPFEITRMFMSSNLRRYLTEIAKTDFFSKAVFSNPYQIKHFWLEETILQIIYLIVNRGGDGLPTRGLSSKEIRNYAMELKESGGMIPDEVAEEFEETLAYLDKAYKGMTKLRELRRNHCTSAFMIASVARAKGVRHKAFVKWLERFIENAAIEHPKYYRASQEGSAGIRNVTARYKEMLNDFEEKLLGDDK